MSGSVWDRLPAGGIVDPATAEAVAAAAAATSAPAAPAAPDHPQTWEVSVKAPDGKWLSGIFFGEHEADMYALATIKQVRAGWNVPPSDFIGVRIIPPA